MAASYDLVRGDLKSPPILPQIDAERCVHALCATASCQKCVVACPRAALTLTQSALGLDQAACDGCGLCQPACPETAISCAAVAGAPLVDGERKVAMAACLPSGVVSGPGAIPCLNALGERELMAFASDGVASLIISRAVCGSCPRATERTLERAVAAVNRLLAAGNAARTPNGMAVHDLSQAEWSRMRDAIKSRRYDLDQSRRALFRSLLGSSTDAECSAQARRVEQGRPMLARFAPRIDEAVCVGCDACARFCPHGVIELVHPGTGMPTYRIEAAQCTGCQVCVDVCEVKAVAVEEFASTEAYCVRLDEHQCVKCGVPFHVPAQKKEDGVSVCRICRRTNHAGRLFQVRS